ncbi:MAG: hypothetical protein ROM03_05050 [Mucispirillum sp.]|nr:hypothetical protein [Mucispirillum sp.]
MKIIYFFFYINIIFLLLPGVSFADNVPEWVLMPDMQGYSFCAAGSAPKNSNLSLQKKIARMNTLSELSKAVEISISNELEIKNTVESRNNKQVNAEKDITSSSRQRSNTIISNAVEIDSFLDNDTGILYLRMCIK